MRFLFFYFHTNSRQLLISKDLFQTAKGKLSPDFVRIRQQSGPDRFYARTLWDSSIPTPSDYTIFKICALATPFVYAPFPNFKLESGGSGDWLEWLDFDDINELNGSGLFVSEDRDLEDDSNRLLSMTIDCATVLQFSVADRAKTVAKPSCPCASLDIDASVRDAFLNHGTRWIKELRDILGRKNFADQKRLEETEKNRKMDEMAAEITQLRSSSQNIPNPPPIQQYVSPTPQQYVPSPGQYSFPPHVYEDPQYRYSPLTKRKLPREPADDSDAEPTVSMSTLKKFFKKHH